MGYELKLLVLRRLTGISKEKIVLVGNEVYSAYPDPDSVKSAYNLREYYYYPDGDTKTYVKDEPMIDSEGAILISMFDLHKLGSDADFGICSFEDANGKTCSVYDPFDGDKFIGLDRYGSYRKILTLDKALKLLEGTQPGFYAVETALSYLRAMAETFKDGSIGCMFYGY